MALLEEVIANLNRDGYPVRNRWTSYGHHSSEIKAKGSPINNKNAHYLMRISANLSTSIKTQRFTDLKTRAWKEVCNYQTK